MRTNPSLSPYFENLHSSPEHIQLALESLFEKYQVQPVGDGYIDLIVDRARALELIAELTDLRVAVERLTWWCNVTPENQSKYGCPHGLGGPLNRSGAGCFSECHDYPDFAIREQPDPVDEHSRSAQAFAAKCNQLAYDYLKDVFQSAGFYSPCLYVGLWLHVPYEWPREDK